MADFICFVCVLGRFQEDTAWFMADKDELELIERDKRLRQYSKYCQQQQTLVA